MPRSLARLRYKAPPKPISFAKLLGPINATATATTTTATDTATATATATEDPRLAQTVARFVERQSRPPLLRLQTVVNTRARPPPIGQFAKPPVRPPTLRDVVDAKATASHGELVYVFRNVGTNQVIYSLQELLDTHHLRQLPFFGKHSTPPTLRPDEWVPHCVVRFPSPAQGHSAFRRLREFRKLHELAWDKTNPEYKRLGLAQRVRRLMDQRANFSADLAEVLRMQADHAVKTRQERDELDSQAATYRVKRWKEIEELAQAAQAAQDESKPADSVTWLQVQVKSMVRKLRMKHNQNEADQKRLKAAKKSLETRLRRVTYAVRKAQQLKETHAELTVRAAPATTADAQEKLRSLQARVQLLQIALDNPDPTRSLRELDVDRDMLAQLNTEINTLTSAMDAKDQLASNTHPTALSVLPKYFTKHTAQPFTLEGVQVAWADLQDAMYAKGQWPDVIEHQSLNLHGSRAQVALLSQEEYAAEVENEVSRIMGALQQQQAAQEEPQQAVA